MPTPTLVLFDIDGTLIHAARAGVRGMNTALLELHHTLDALEGVPIAGRTDVAIIRDVFGRLGVEPTTAAIEQLRDAYLAHLAAELGRPTDRAPCVLPGVVELLDALDRHPDVTVGLLTGNFAGGAAIKLGHFNLWHRFGFGAFGDGHVDRRDLVPVAIARARASGVDASPERTIIVGDTPLDIDCAHAHGAKAIGVATGPFGVEELAAAGADLVVKTLEALHADRQWLGMVV